VEDRLTKELAAEHEKVMTLGDEAVAAKMDLAQEKLVEAKVVEDAAKAGKASAEEGKAAAEGDLVATEKDLANSKELLQTSQENCMQVAADHGATVKSRDEELKVVAEARQILVDTTSGAESQTYSLLQVMARSRLQSSTDLAGAEAINLVKKIGART